MDRQSVRPSSGSRLPGIDGLRALAATAIVLYHAWLLGSSGANFGPLSRFFFPHLPVGVTLFFALSGFLLYRPFAAAMIRDHPLPRVGSYLRNRALRIFPAYWVVLLVGALVLEAVFVRTSPLDLATGGLRHDPVTLLRNVVLIQNYHPDTYFTGIGPAWSLAIEVVFYLALPILALIAVRLAVRASTARGRTLAAFAPAAILLALGLSGKIVATFLVPARVSSDWIGWIGSWNSVLERSFWAQADLFAFGVALAVLAVRFEDGAFRLPRWWRFAVASALALLVLATVTLSADGRLGRHKYQMATAVACALLLSLVVLVDRKRTPPLLLRLLERRFVVGVGLVSYSLFLWHEPLIRWMSSNGLLGSGWMGFLWTLLLVAVAGGALSALTYRFVEVPALRRKHRMQRRRTEDSPSEDREGVHEQEPRNSQHGRRGGEDDLMPAAVSLGPPGDRPVQGKDRE
jgi:peptidoglycan/LPS O-acetylase OafA/YrhL